jgi:hypothetical protein
MLGQQTVFATTQAGRLTKANAHQLPTNDREMNIRLIIHKLNACAETSISLDDLPSFPAK